MRRTSLRIFSESIGGVGAVTGVATSNTSNYCDCTDTYIASLPNGSVCPNTTEWNSWTLVCDPLTSSDRNKSNETAEETATLDAAEVAAALEATELIKMTMYNYTAYDEDAYPSTRPARATGCWILGMGDRHKHNIDHISDLILSTPHTYFIQCHGKPVLFQDCKSNCTKLMKKNLGVEYYIASCTDNRK
eukprot:sb/3471175/